MTEGLAEQLKNAGFPQSGKSKSPYVPSLAELISACSNQFWSLRRSSDGRWIAAGRLSAKKEQIPYYESAKYDEPDAAVAEIYLAIKLHEKKK